MAEFKIKEQYLTDNHPQKHYLPNFIAHVIYVVTCYYFFDWMCGLLDVENMNKNQVYFQFTFPFILAILAVINIIYTFVYWIEHPAIEARKITTTPWLWKSDPVFWKKMLPDLIYTYIRNFAFFGVFAYFVLTYFVAPNYNLADRPSFLKHFLHIYISTFMEDFIFYWSHRLLHLPWFYKRVHKQHHFTADIMHLNCIYTHWFEFLVGNILPFLGGLFVCGNSMHVITFMTWSFYRIIETHEVHCGYEMPVSIFPVFPFSTNATYHNFHHFKNVGNYATFFTFWDDIFGTNKYYNEAISDLQKKEKAN